MQLMQLAEVYKTDYHSCFCVAEHLAATVQDFQELIDAVHLLIYNNLYNLCSHNIKQAVTKSHLYKQPPESLVTSGMNNGPVLHPVLPVLNHQWSGLGLDHQILLLTRSSILV